MLNLNTSGRRNSIRSYRDRKLAPTVEAVERRQMLDGAAGYLAGTVYLDSNANGAFDIDDAYLAGAKIDLSILGRSGIVATTTTDANGSYSFANLTPGDYVLTETPPTDLSAVDARVLSRVNPAARASANSINVTVIDPTQVYVKNNGIISDRALGLFDTIYQESQETNTGPLNVDLGTSPGSNNLASNFLTFCLDGLALLSATGGESFRVIPSNIDTLTNGRSATISTEAAGRISFLYNHFGNSSLTNIQGPALQLAIWELIYDQSPDLSFSTGNFQTSGPVDANDQTLFDAVIQQANSYLSLSQGKFENATFLDARTPASTENPEFSQSVIASGSLDFLNKPTPIPPPVSSIAGFVYVDANNDGIKESTEAPIPGTTVTLTGTDNQGNPVTFTAVTDNLGAYSFTNLKAGTYTLTETQPTGFLDGKDTQGTPGTGTVGNDVFTSIILGENVNGTDNNFGELLPPVPVSSIAGFVYVDANNDGIKESTEAPIPGTTVTLTGTDNQGNPVTFTAVTDNLGAYSFTNLKAGTYTLTETQPTGFLDGKDTQGTPGTGTVGNDVFTSIILGENVNGTDNNFGELLPPVPVSSIAGFVYVDANNDGIKESTEAPIPGTTVTLTGTDNQGNPVTFTAVTDNLGAYSFTNLKAGTYTLTETQPTGFLDGKDTQGTPGTGTVGNDVFTSIILGENVNGTDNNFGELLPPVPVSSIAGFVYVDANNDGIKESTEAPIPGTTVTLTGTDNQGNPVTFTAVTDNLGAYSFTNLQAGTYTLTETQPTGFLDGKDTQGTPGTGTAGNDFFRNITLGENVNGTDNNFGELRPASIAGFVYVDANDNGVKETGEAPIPGTTVTLTGTDDLGNSITWTTTTDDNGAYRFDGLRPGIYTINETQPNNFDDGKDSQGTPGNGVTGNDVFTGITLDQGVSGVDNNFGELTQNSNPGQMGNPPRVVSLELFGIHHQQSSVVVKIVGDVDPDQVSNLANYHLIALGKDQRLNTGDDRNIPIRSVSFNPSTGELTIIPAYHLDFHYHYLLQINVPASGTTQSLTYSEVFGRSAMTVWDWHGKIIPAPRMTARQIAADARIKDLAYGQLALRAGSVRHSAAIRTFNVHQGTASMVSRAAAHRAASFQHARLPIMARHTAHRLRVK